MPSSKSHGLNPELLSWVREVVHHAESLTDEWLVFSKAVSELEEFYQNHHYRSKSAHQLRLAIAMLRPLAMNVELTADELQHRSRRILKALEADLEAVGGESE